MSSGGQRSKYYLILLIRVTFYVQLVRATPFLESDNNNFTKDFVILLNKINKERNYNTIVLCQSQTTDCILDKLLSEISLPVVLINKKLQYTYTAQFSKELLILFCMEHTSLAEALTKFNIFRGMKRTRIIVYTPNTIDLVQIQQYCLDAMANDIYNVLIINKDFATTHNYYTCNKYPLDVPAFKEKSLVSTNKSSAGIIFEEQFLNMYGAKILTYPDQLEPRSMLYYKPDGTIELEGYIGRVLRIFAQRRNATLKIEYPYVVGKTVFYGKLLELAANDTIDIAAGLAYPFKGNDLELMTYPLQLLDYCYMLPVPETVPINELFVGIIRLPTLLCIFIFIIVFAALLTHINNSMKISFINLFLNDQAIRGMLGQSFILTAQPGFKFKFIVFLLCYMSIITNTTYQAYLQSFLTSPPQLPMHRNYEDIETAGLKILFSSRELDMIQTNQNITQYKHLFKIVADYDSWLRCRLSMNTKYAYPVSNVRWEVFDFQQTFFTRPIFYFNRDICFFRSAPVCMPIRLDLPYRDLLDEFVLRLQSSGILDIWVALNFYVMVKLKKAEFRDLSEPIDKGRPLVVEDFFWIYIQYFGCMALGVAAFVGEILYNHWINKKLDAKPKKQILD